MRFLRHFAFVAVAVGLSGCLIQQEAPQPQNPVTDQIRYQGLVSMLELRFLNQGAAAVLAGFNKIVADSPGGGATSRTSREGMIPAMDIHVFDRVSIAPWSQFGFVDPRSLTRGGDCKKLVGPRSDRAARVLHSNALGAAQRCPRTNGSALMRDCVVSQSERNGTYSEPPAKATSKTTGSLGEAISVGQLQFGLDHQTTFTAMAEDAQHNYGLTLNPPVPAGDYLIGAEGNKALGIEGFKVGFSMPEAITGIRFNGNYIDRPGVEIPRNTPLKIEWDSPSVPNAQNMLGLVLISEDVTTRHVLICAGRENEVASLDAHGQPSWSIDPSWLSDLFDGDGTQVYFTREILASAEGNGLHLDLEGVRKWMSVAIVR